jgi:cytochrome c553
MTAVFVLAVLFGWAGLATAADIEAGKQKAAACTACHGANGISVAPDIANLAGQKEAYLKAQLQAFRGGTRKNPLMNAMAPQLSDPDIANLAAFFASLPPATATVQSPTGEELAKVRMKIPASYKRDFTHYTTINFPDRKQVRLYYANKTALDAAGRGVPLPNGSAFLVEVYSAKLDAQGKPVVGADGFFERDKLVLFTAMEQQSGWGAGIPEELRNGDWNYALFATDGTPRKANQATCLACHKPLEKDSYVFSLKQLAETARARR